MNDLFPLYLKAAILVAFSLALTAGVTALAWRSNVHFARLARAWLRDLPDRLRARRDPAFRRQRERAMADAAVFAQYEAMNGLLQKARTRREHAAHVLSHLVDPSTPGMTGRIHEDACEEHAGSRSVVASYFRGLSDDDIAAIARVTNAQVYDGRIPQADLEAFFRDERERIAESERLADTHFARLIGRFAAYAESPGKALAKGA